MKKIRLHPFFTQNKIAFLSIGVIFFSLLVGNSFSYQNPNISKIIIPDEASEIQEAILKASQTTNKTEQQQILSLGIKKAQEREEQVTVSTNKVISPDEEPEIKEAILKAIQTTNKTEQQQILSKGIKAAQERKTRENETRKLPNIASQRNIPAPDFVDAVCFNTCVAKGGTSQDCITGCPSKPLPNPRPQTTSPSQTPDEDWGELVPVDLTNIDPQSSCVPGGANVCGENSACTALARPVDTNYNLLNPDKPTVYGCRLDPNFDNRSCEVPTGNTGEYLNVEEGFIFDKYVSRCETEYDPVLRNNINTGYIFTKSICANGSIFEVNKKSYNPSLCPQGPQSPDNTIGRGLEYGPACGLIVLGQNNDTGVTDFKDSQCCKYVDINNGQSPDGIPYKNMCSGFEPTPDKIYDLFHNEVGTFGFPEFGVSEFIGGILNDIFP